MPTHPVPLQGPHGDFWGHNQLGLVQSNPGATLPLAPQPPPLYRMSALGAVLYSVWNGEGEGGGGGLPSALSLASLHLGYYYFCNNPKSNLSPGWRGRGPGASGAKPLELEEEEEEPEKEKEEEGEEVKAEQEQGWFMGAGGLAPALHPLRRAAAWTSLGWGG